MPNKGRRRYNMERIFKTAREFEEFFANGSFFDENPWLRKCQEAKNICDRRYAVWCEKNNVPEEYEAMVLAIEDYANYLESKEDRDVYDEWNLKTWKQLLAGEVPEMFCEPEEDESLE